GLEGERLDHLMAALEDDLALLLHQDVHEIADGLRFLLLVLVLVLFLDADHFLRLLDESLQGSVFLHRVERHPLLLRLLHELGDHAAFLGRRLLVGDRDPLSRELRFRVTESSGFRQRQIHSPLLWLFDPERFPWFITAFPHNYPRISVLSTRGAPGIGSAAATG